MKFQKEKIYSLLVTTASIALGVYFWKIIHIPYTANGIIGDYSLNNYSSINDPLKYIIFILFPVFTFLSCKVLIEKKKLNILFNSIKLNQSELIYNNKQISVIFYVLIFFLILEFLSINFSYAKLDIFHSGQRLSSAFKNYLDNSLWSGSYVTGGIILETLGTKFIWKIFGHQSIGLMRYYEIILILFTKFFLLILALQVSKSIKLKSIFKSIFFLLLSIIFLSFVDYDINSADLIETREIPNLILLTILVIYLRSPNDNFRLLYIFIGFLSIFSFFWSVDRAIVFNVLIISILIFFIINKNYRSTIYIIFSALLFWLLFFFILGDEFFLFLSNTTTVITEISDIHGFKHPLPFTDEINSSRATKTLLAILFSALFSINFLFKENLKNYVNKMFLVFISLTSFISYIYALGRSDGGHIKQAFGYPSIFFTVLILYFILNLLDKIRLNKFKNYLSIFTISAIFIFILFQFQLNISNIINYSKNFKNFIYADDKKFLQEDDIKFIEEASFLLKSEKCIQLYTYDSALLYLLKKPSCTKFYFIWSIASEAHQKILINDLENTNTIISNGKTDHWGIKFKIKYPILDEYINNNFNQIINVGSRKIRYRNDAF
tara:strand:+ start:814 stop:2637 length:1824 start_codon:yes stop_codon:yes gene_type:complete